MPADRREHAQVAVGQHLQEAAPGQAGGQAGCLVALDADDGGQHVDADRRAHLGQPAEAPPLLLVEQLVGRVHRLRERRRRHHVGEADQSDLHGHLLDEQGEPAGRGQQAAYVALVGHQVDGVAAGGLHAAQEQVHRRPGQRLVGARHGQRTDADHPFAGLTGHRPCRDGDPGPAGRLDELLEGWPQAVGVDVDAVDDQQRLGPVEGAAQRAGGAVAGCRLGAHSVQARRQDGVGGAQSLRVDPRRRLGARREVADQQGLAAARRSDHADPARARQRVVELKVDALAPQTGGQHGRNLSRRTTRTADTSAVRGRRTYVSDLGRTTDAGAPWFGRG